jgi:hypothetical protein
MSTHETTTDVPSDDQVWLNQMQPTSRPAQSYSSPFSEDPSLQPTMMSQQPGMYGVSQPSYMSNMQKQDMYRAFLELQRQRQQQFAAVSMQQQNTMTPTMEHYLAQNHNSNSNNNSSSSNNNSSNDHMLYHANHPRNTNQPYMPLSNQITYQEHSYQPKKSMHQEGMVGGLDGTPSKHSASSSNAPSSSFNISNNNSCALNKAHLKLVGNLMDTIVNWTVSEWQSGRRLVQFWRTTQTDAEGNLTLVECGFNPMDQQQYHQQRMRDNVAAVAAATAAAVAVTSSGPMNVNMNRPTSASPIVISCIYWRERNDYFITSVDCIYLLESLIGIQFTVEEKNRIRRNLEGFRPLTVSKCKIECADFFKLIMSFPHPKPRNIEKDVKVFAWKTLPHALRKIIRKYTPSYITSAPLEPIQTHEPGRSMSTGSLTFAPPTLHDGY